MKVQKTYTFIVSRNFGKPISLQIPAWRVYLVLVLATVVSLGVLGGSLLFFINYPRLYQLQDQVERLQEERDVLRQKISTSMNHIYLRKESRFSLNSPVSTAKSLPSRPLFSVPAAFGESYVPPVRVSSVTTRINRKQVDVSFRLERNVEGEQGRGGYVFIVFENRGVDPPRFVTQAPIKTNAQGFPLFYKRGRFITRIQRPVTIRQKTALAARADYYTHVAIYLFSYRGALLVKDRIPFDRSWFDSDRPVIHTTNLPQV